MTDDLLPVVLVHGIRVSAAMWHAQVTALGGHRPVLAPDMPGHGKRRAERFTMSGALDVIAGAIDTLGGRALLVGHSMGGYLTIAAAAAYPERVAGLMAFGCTTLPTPARARPYLLAANLLARLPDGGARLTRVLSSAVLGREAASVFTGGGVSYAVIPDVVDAVLARNPLADLREYPGPVWLVNGTKDHFRTDERQFLAACRDGRLELLRNTGHLAPLTAADDVTRLIDNAAFRLGLPENRSGARENR
jgi:pimeloyl-ACP methyl ester carboxylesterase